MLAVTNAMMFKLPDFMATNDRKSDTFRPRALHTSKSFTRAEPERLTRSQRASTIHTNVIPESAVTGSRGKPISQRMDVFERNSDEDGEVAATSEEDGKYDKMEELPIELASLSDRLVMYVRVPRRY